MKVDANLDCTYIYYIFFGGGVIKEETQVPYSGVKINL